jgi:6,7-dimethyl-8-ribityllumazine synthase
MTSSNETTALRSDIEDQNRRVRHVIEPSADGSLQKIGIVCGKFNDGITTRLLTGALDVLLEAGVSIRDIAIAWVPGAFEIPFAAKAFTQQRVGAVITLGAVIRGDTGHYEVVAGECARGVQEVQLATGVPVIFGVLTTNTIEQALERSLPDETNKGRESAFTALEMIAVQREIGRLEWR